MDRIQSILAVAGVGCFALAFVLSGVYPWMITDGTVAEASIAEVAERITPEFVDLAQRYPVAFDGAHPGVRDALAPDAVLAPPGNDPGREAGMDAWQTAHAESLRRGRDRYIAEGCWHCHSQYVRPVSNEDVRFGPVSRWQQDNNALQRPVMWGTRRVGPDLTYEGGLRSNDWHTAHFWDPQAVSPGSVMPRFRWFFEEGYRLVRGIDPDVAERNGLSPDTTYPIPGVYPTEAAAQEARERHVASLPTALSGEAERIRVEPGRTLNDDGLAVVSYLQWLGTWQPPEAPEE